MTDQRDEAREAAVILTEAGYDAYQSTDAADLIYVGMRTRTATRLAYDLANRHAEPAGITLLIVQGTPAQTVARIDGWKGPVPSVGEYIFHPTADPEVEAGKLRELGTSGCVLRVTWGIMARPNRDGPYKGECFTGHPQPFAEVLI